MIQLSRFEGGGFVLHKVPVGGQVYSAWFDAEGTLLDAERTTRKGRTSSVPPSSTRIRLALQAAGRRHLQPK